MYVHACMFDSKQNKYGLVESIELHKIHSNAFEVPLTFIIQINLEFVQNLPKLTTK